MANKKKSFILYFDSYPSIERLPDEECGKLLRALFQYAESVREEDKNPLDALEQFPEMGPETRMAFCFMAGNIRRDTAVWLKRQQTLSEAAKEYHQKQKGGSRGSDEMRKYVRDLHRDAGETPEPQEKPGEDNRGETGGDSRRDKRGEAEKQSKPRDAAWDYI